MKLKSGIALLGALASTALTVGAFLLLDIGWIFLVVFLGLNLVSYIVAAIGAGKTRINAFTEFMRGWLIGSNTGLNAVFVYALVSLFAGPIGGIVAGGVLGTINFLTVFALLTQTAFYRGVVGYFNLLLPMSWLVVALGFTFWVLSYILHGVTLGKVNYLKVQGIKLHGKTGTLFIKGGLIANLNYGDTAFNMGNFAFVDKDSTKWWLEHESGHTLNLAAFGSVFHFAGAIEENATPRKDDAFSERLAESHASGSGSNNIPMWA